jgi:hypothetical protein
MFARFLCSVAVAALSVSAASADEALTTCLTPRLYDTVAA